MNVVGEFDFVVVGGGTAGCVVAARLSESGKYTVAMLEAGGEDKSFWIHAPLGYGMLYDNPKFNWLYESEAEPALAAHRSYQPRGKVLGGTGSINGMIYMRGARQDYEHWRQLGNVGWSYDDVLPYFKKSEDNERGASREHGSGGPLRISNTPRHELADAFIKAGEQAGFPLNPDFNGPKLEGFGYNQITTKNGRRCSTATAFLHPARKRRNLTVLLHSLATRIIFKDGRATGVEFTKDGMPSRVVARREIVLAGGSFNSPQLLQLSGIGPADLLGSFGIPVVANLPGVGENLQDHFGISVSYRCTKPFTVNDIARSRIRRYAMGIQYLLFHTGFMAANASLAGGCIKTDPSLDYPDAKINLQLWNRAGFGRNKENVGLYPYSSFSTNVMLLRPDNRGTVHIKSADPTVAPEMRFNLFVSEKDHRTSVTALRIMHKVMSMPAVAPYVLRQEDPIPDYNSDASLIDYCRHKGRSTHHGSSTCKMGVDDRAVVDPQLRVRGVSGLRVADASVIPTITSGNVQAPTIMIGERAASMILEDAR
jgi:choline dehydrogenase